MPIIIEQDTYPQEGVGLPDYSAPKPVGQVPTPKSWTLTDLAEHAARVDSIYKLDRRGEVVFIEDFQDSLNKWAIDVGGTSSWSLSVLAALIGTSSARVITSAGAGDYLYVFHFVPAFLPVRWGAQILFSTPSVNFSFDAIISFRDGTRGYVGELRYNDTNTRLEYLNSAGVYTVFQTGIGLYSQLSFFHCLKIVAEYSTRRYVRAVVDGQDFDMSGLDLLSGVSALAPHIMIGFRLTGPNKIAHVGGAIATQNEPANIRV